jgi:hypothetical protein
MSHYISGVAADDNLTRIHSIANAVLAVATYDYSWAVHKGGQVISRNSADADIDLALEPATDIPLAVDIINGDFFFTTQDGLLNLFVQVFIM